VAPGAGGSRSTVTEKLESRYVRFSQLPVVASVTDAGVNNVIKQAAATSGAETAFAPGKVDPGFEQRLLSVSMTPGNLGSFASDQLDFNDTSAWVDENVPQIRVPSVIIGAQDDHFISTDQIHRLADTLPGTQLVMVDGSHMIPYTHPDVIAEQVRSASRR
jgi:pimeloyl-ACP methyl ester carboxylesterase